MKQYAVSIRWSDEDRGFIASVAQLPGLTAFGETREQALSELETASEAYLESLTHSGRSIPEPEKMTYHSGQIRLRMPKMLHASLASGAKENNVSLNTYLVSLLSERHILHEVLAKLSHLEDHSKTMDDHLSHELYSAASVPSKIDESCSKYKKK